MQNEKNVLVTGASSGVGYATVLELQARGYTVFAAVRKEADAKKIKSERIIPVFLDVTSDSQLLDAYHIIKSTCEKDGLYALINNAGITYTSPFEITQEKMARELMEINFFGPYKIMQLFIPLLKHSAALHGNGKIININSIGGLQGIPWISFYSASKFALMGLTEAIRLELKQFNIQVTSLVLGAVKTPMNQKNEASAQQALDHLPSELSDFYFKGLTLMKNAAKQSEKYASSPEEVANKIAQILSHKKTAAHYILGGSAIFMNILIKYIPASWRHSLLSNNMGL
jgi:NAD(P)-dependent dehydrogenase (short-subunit alcohol dehydrogenase family)